jgi:UDPglucose 6-dehydrogenase
MKIGVVGLGKLGIPLASVMGKAGHEVIGVDVDYDKVTAISKGQNPLPAEPDIDVSVISATRDYNDLRKSDVIFVVTNTPPDTEGDLSLGDLVTACRQLTIHAKDGAIIVISSTVPPLTMNKIIAPIFKERGLRVVYNPFFIALGKIVSDLVNPDFVIIGGEDKTANEIIYGIWKGVTDKYRRSLPANRFPRELIIHRTNFRTAEMIKFGLTPYLVQRINWANTLCQVAEHIGGVNIDEVTQIIGLDRRINTRFLSAGLPWGGDCYPKDVKAFANFCDYNHIGIDFFDDLIDTNDWFGTILKQIIRRKAKSIVGKKIAFLGVSYKKGYPLLNKSTPYALYEALNKDTDVWAHDPHIVNLPNGQTTKYLAECLDGAEIVIIAVAYPEYQNLKLADLLSPQTPVIDLCRVLAGTEIALKGNWLPLGMPAK